MDATLLNRPLVTAVITTCRRPVEVQRAIRSVGAETYPNIECLVVEDGDELDESVLDGCSHPSRLIQHRSPIRLGVAGARNRGLENASGMYIICLDDDDIVEAHRIARLVESAQSGGFDLVYGLTRKHYPGDKGEVLPIPTWPRHSRAITFTDMLICMPHVNATLIRVDALRAVGGYDSLAPHFDEWSPLLKILAEGGRGGFISEIVADWLAHDEGLSGEVRREESMHYWIETLLHRILSTVEEPYRSQVVEALEVVSTHRIEGYDIYAELMMEHRASGSLDN